MLHPYAASNPPGPKSDLTFIEATLKYCTTYKGVPFGPAKICFTDDDDKGLSFKALGVFNNGIL